MNTWSNLTANGYTCVPSDFLLRYVDLGITMEEAGSEVDLYGAPNFP
jgi:hypothetical protein